MEPQVLEFEDITKRLEEFAEWEYDQENMVLFTEIELESFHEAADFVHQVAEITETLDHHPDILLHNYKFVTIYATTHAVGGITEKDFELMEAIEDLFDQIEDADAGEETASEGTEEVDLA